MPDGPSYDGPVPIQINFYLDDKGASTTQDMNLEQRGTAAAHTTWRAPKAGSFLGMSVVSNAARTGGTLSARFTISGTATGTASGTLLDATFTRENSFFQAPGIDKFAAGDLIGMELVGASWGPTTADIRGTLYITLEP